VRRNTIRLQELPGSADGEKALTGAIGVRCPAERKDRSVIAVTCRNGEHFSVDPQSIERIETDPDTVVFLVDGTKYVVDQSFDEMLRMIRDHRAAFVAASMQLTRTPTRSLHPSHVAGRRRTSDAHDGPPPVRIERRQYRRDESPGDTGPGTGED
jgi:uncharacterized protein YlzI (FlbEa/FlbD family)